MRWLLRKLVRLYQLLWSSWTPGTCRFQPTCSNYAEEALQKHNVFKAGLLISWRLLRCQPFCKHGYDPVPETGTWRHPDRDLHAETVECCDCKTNAANASNASNTSNNK